MKCIAVISQKGGVGKTTTTNALGAGLYLKGNRVLCIDLCAQHNLSFTMGHTGGGHTSYDVLAGSAAAVDAIIHTPQGDLIPAGPDLASADLTIKDPARLKEALLPVKKDYDFIILDTPPTLGIRTVNALTAAHSVIIPTQADTYSLQGIGQLYDTIRAVKAYSNKRLRIDGILATRHNSRTIFTQDMTTLLEDTAAQIRTQVYNTKIRECVAIREAQNRQQDIFTYSPRSNGAKDYRAFIEEVLQVER